MKKPTPAQLAARERFAEMARSGAFKRKAKKAKANPRKKTVSQKISQLVHEGYPQKQAVAVALSEQRAGKVKRNPASGRKGSRTKLNPMAAPVQVSSDSMFKYAVEAKRSLGSAGAVFETVAAFRTKAQAQDYAKAILASHPSATLRIKTYSRQK